MSSTEWSAKIKSLRALISQQPNNETKSPPSRSPPKPKQLPTQELPSQETKQKTPSPPIRRLSHEQIPDVQKLVRETIEQSGLNTADSYNKNIVNAVAIPSSNLNFSFCHGCSCHIKNNRIFTRARP